MSDVALSISDLSVGYRRPDGRIDLAVRDVCLILRRGQITGLAGESGCGKSTTALAGIGFRGPNTVITGGQVWLGERELLSLPIRDLRRIWGSRIAFVPQNAAASLNPAFTIGQQLGEPLALHAGLRGSRMKAKQLELLGAVGLPDPERALRKFPHQFSGGQQQRAMIAIALSCSPDVLVLDEPTTGLDVTTQARITSLLRTLVLDRGLAALYVSHDLALLGTLADRIAVMYGGEIVEEGSATAVLTEPLHPYSRALFEAVPSARSARRIVGISGNPPARVSHVGCAFAPRCKYALSVCDEPQFLQEEADRHSVRCVRATELVARGPYALRTRQEDSDAPTPHDLIPAGAENAEDALLTVSAVTCSFGGRKARLVAVEDMSFQLRSGQRLGIVGESGSGKSTLLRAIVGLHSPESGEIAYRGSIVNPIATKRPRHVRKDIQIVFQNPDLSLNPRNSVRSLIARPMRLLVGRMSHADESARIAELMDAVKLSRHLLGRFPAELSGGQKQRVALARAFGVQPSLLLCDEATSSLDVSVQATIIELIHELASRHNAAVIFVSHDFAVVRNIADRVMVMREGVSCEEGSVEDVFRYPTHSYTKELLAAIPDDHLASFGVTG